MNRVLVVVFLWSALLLCSCEAKKTPPAGPVPVNLYTVKSQKVLYYDNFPGTVTALSQVDIRPEVQGYITAINFVEGTHVTKGKVLYEIDIRLYQAAYDQAIANLKVAQGTQLQAQQDADRYTYLNQKDAVAKQLYDHAIVALDNAKSSVQAAEQQVKSAKANLSYAVITAPFDGTIGFSQVKLGNMVTVGSTVLNTISTDDPMAVDFLINEAQLAHYKDLESNKQGKVDSLFTLVLPDHSIYPQPGKISVIDRGVDPQTGTVRIRLVFPNPKYTLRAGMSCVVRVHNQEATPQLVIPARAVIEQMGEYFVFIARDTLIQHADTAKKEKEKAESATGKQTADTGSKGPSLHAFQVKVQLGQTIDSSVIVRAGLEENDQIVVDGIQALHQGSKIAVGPAKPKAEGSTAEAKEGEDKGGHAKPKSGQQ